MKRIILVLAVLSTGCENDAARNAGGAENAVQLADRERQLIERCNQIAIEHEVLAAKYNAIIRVHGLHYRPVQLTIERCS